MPPEALQGVTYGLLATEILALIPHFVSTPTSFRKMPEGSCGGGNPVGSSGGAILTAAATAEQLCVLAKLASARSHTLQQSAPKSSQRHTRRRREGDKRLHTPG